MLFDTFSRHVGQVFIWSTSVQLLDRTRLAYMTCGSDPVCMTQTPGCILQGSERPQMFTHNHGCTPCSHRSSGDGDTALSLATSILGQVQRPPLPFILMHWHLCRTHGLSCHALRGLGQAQVQSSGEGTASRNSLDRLRDLPFFCQAFTLGQTVGDCSNPSSRSTSV